MSKLSVFFRLVASAAKGAVNPIIGVIKYFGQREPARIIAYGVAGSLTLANVIAHALGYTALPDGIANGLTLFVTALVTEAIRRCVYSPATVEAIQVNGD